jgi:hypothetical protein
LGREAIWLIGEEGLISFVAVCLQNPMVTIDRHHQTRVRDVSRMSITPEKFWRHYKQELRTTGSWKTYQSNRSWTQIAKTAAIATCERLGLKTGREYFRLDAIGYTQRKSDRFHWDLRVAFEVENSGDWRDESCKLSHIIADLRVLVAYELHNLPEHLTRCVTI